MSPNHTYLFAHCYRQFGWDPFPFSESTVGTHDWDCTADVTVARVPRGASTSNPSTGTGRSGRMMPAPPSR